jgi:hypothetical protein
MRMEVAELRDCGRLKDIRAFIDDLYGHDLHAKRVDSLAAATLGVMTGASLAVAMIGQALAQARGLVTKHAIKQVDRLLSNGGIDVWESFACWVPHLVGSHNDIVVAMVLHEYCAGGGLPPGRGINQSGWWRAYRSLSSGSARCIRSWLQPLRSQRLQLVFPHRQPQQRHRPAMVGHQIECQCCLVVAIEVRPVPC